MLKRTTLTLIGAIVLVGSSTRAGDPVALRITNLGVTPAHMPLIAVWVRNLGEASYSGSIRLELPDGWSPSVPAQDVSLKPGEAASVRFTIHDGKNREENRYTVSAVAEGVGQEVRRSQEIVCASAPYFKPEIDGAIDDWKDAIPAAFVAQGRKTTIRTFWNRRQFSMLVAVEEDELVRQGDDKPFDAVQIAISPQDTQTSAKPGNGATRHEFLLAAGGAGQGGSASNDDLDIKIDREKYLVYKDGNEYTFPKKEFELLSLLISKPGKVFTREVILESVWGGEVIVGDRTIDVHIRKLREKLGDNYIKTIKGVGYKFEA